MLMRLLWVLSQLGQTARLLRTVGNQVQKGVQMPQMQGVSLHWLSLMVQV